eukprot:GCRY01006383.1.p1 GENE.GCRY01006383.1~~GCRY01006383.1.p1  ORF type:complete len:204 (-),score=28.24 GCRY01006383.1:166-777(-)
MLSPYRKEHRVVIKDVATDDDDPVGVETASIVEVKASLMNLSSQMSSLQNTMTKMLTRLNDMKDIDAVEEKGNEANIEYNFMEKDDEEMEVIEEDALNLRSVAIPQVHSVQELMAQWNEGIAPLNKPLKLWQKSERNKDPDTKRVYSARKSIATEFERIGKKNFDNLYGDVKSIDKIRKMIAGNNEKPQKIPEKEQEEKKVRQ